MKIKIPTDPLAAQILALMAQPERAVETELPAIRAAIRLRQLEATLWLPQIVEFEGMREVYRAFDGKGGEAGTKVIAELEKQFPSWWLPFELDCATGCAPGVKP